jgi:probable addiction module antidote protein
MTKLAPFDAADYLDDEETIAEYLTAALEDPDPEMFLVAVRTVARARGMTQLAKDAGLGRESLYKALSPGAKPRYDTVLKLVHALGVKLAAVPAHGPDHGLVKESEEPYDSRRKPKETSGSGRRQRTDD